MSVESSVRVGGIPRPRSRRRTSFRVSSPMISVSFGLFVLGVWQLLGELGVLPEYVLAPVAIVRSIVDHIDTLAPAAWSTLQLVLLGFAAGTAVGVVVGLLAGVVRMAEDLVDPVIGVVYPLPKITLFPILAVWMGFTDSARILLIAITCFFPSYVNAHGGTRGVGKRLLWVASNAGAKTWTTLRSVVFRAALPRVLAGIRISLALAFLAAFAVETLTASNDGLANEVFLSYDSQDYSLMWAATVTFGLLGFLGDRIVAVASRRLTRGQTIATGGGRG